MDNPLMRALGFLTLGLRAMEPNPLDHEDQLRTFLAGGPIRYPILITAVVAVAVVGERAFWWWRESRKRDPETLEKLFAALENGDFREASRLSKDSHNPVIRMIYHGMTHFHSSLVGALQVAAGAELQKA